MPVKEKFEPSFGGTDFSIESPNLVSSEDLNSFLGADPDDLTEIDDPKGTLANTKTKDPKDTKTEGDDGQGEVKKKPFAEVKKPLSIDEVDLFNDEDEEGKDNKEEVIEDKNNPLKKKVPITKTEDKKDEPEETTYSTLAKDLLNLGVFTADEDDEGNEVTPEINTAEDFLKQFQTEVRKQTGNSIQKFLEQFGPEYSEMFDAVYVNGVPPYEYLSRQAKIDNIQEYDITSEDNQEKIVRQWYRTEGRTPEAIEARIQKIKNIGDLEEEAKEAKTVLVGKEQKDLQNLALQKQEDLKTKQKMKSDYTANVYKIVNEKFKAKDFDGIPIDKKFSEQTYNYLTKDLYKTKDNTLLTEFDKDILDLNRPENHSNKVKLAMLMQIIKTDPTLSKLGKKAVSKEANKLFSEVERKFGKSTSNTKVSTEDLNNNWQ